MKKYIKDKLKKIKLDQENFKKRYDVQLPQQISEHESTYYSVWYYNAIHMLATIPAFQTVDRIANHLKLENDLVEEVLNKLKEFELIDKKNNKWVATNKNIHLDKKSLFNKLNHTHWRNKANEASFLNLSDNIHYSSLYTLSSKDVEKIREVLFESIDRTRDIVIPSKEEELVCLNIDFFKL